MSISKYLKPKSGRDLPSPRDIVKQADIEYFETSKQVVISGIEPPVWLTTVEDTNSMDPSIDAGHTCILIGSFDSNDLAVGDVVVYYPEAYPQGVMHRIVKIERDEVGRKFTLKGDNNYKVDPYIIRGEHIRWLLIGIIY